MPRRLDGTKRHQVNVISPTTLLPVRVSVAKALPESAICVADSTVALLSSQTPGKEFCSGIIAGRESSSFGISRRMLDPSKAYNL